MAIQRDVQPPSPSPPTPAPAPQPVKLDPVVTLAQVLEDLLTYILAQGNRKPANPAAWEALRRLDETRRNLQRSLGADATELKDPYGRVKYDHPHVEGKK